MGTFAIIAFAIVILIMCMPGADETSGKEDYRLVPQRTNSRNYPRDTLRASRRAARPHPQYMYDPDSGSGTGAGPLILFLAIVSFASLSCLFVVAIS